MYLGIFSSVAWIVPVVIVAALVCGIVYLLQGYSKQAAGWYKAFLVLTAIYNIFTVYAAFLRRGFGLVMILLAVKAILLLVLAFWKDLGKRKTWILYGCIMGVYVIILLLAAFDSQLVPYRLIAIASRLVMDGTIGLAIRGKYADKEARGRT